MIARLLSLGVLVAGLQPLTLRAQHYHRHGNHFDYHENVRHGHDAAGHMIDRYGHHIDGDGRHTGAIGVYENGSTDPPYRSSYYPSYQNFYYPSYSSPYYPSYYPQGIGAGVIYQAPRQIYGAAAVAPLPQTMAANKVPVKNPAVQPRRPSAQARLSNPRGTGGAIHYTLNSIPYTIKPGETQTINLDRDWTIEFDNGYQRQIAYRLAEGDYEFTVSQDTGWDVVKRTSDASSMLPPTDVPSTPANSIPLRATPTPLFK